MTYGHGRLHPSSPQREALPAVPQSGWRNLDPDHRLALIERSLGATLSA